MYMTLSCINMFKMNNNRERRKECERVGGDGVTGCSLGEPLKRQETFQTFLYIQTHD